MGNKGKQEFIASLKQNSNIKFIPLTGKLDGKMYHTVFSQHGIKFRSHLLFDDGEVVNLISKSLGYDSKGKHKVSLFYRDGFTYVIDTNSELQFVGGIVNTIDNAGITSFLEGKIVNKNNLRDSLNSILYDFYDFHISEEQDIVFAHIIHTYLLGVLGKTFYLMLDGERNTGKSSLQNIMSLLQFNGSFSGKTTVPSLIRKIHYWMASINIDEFEKLGDREKRAFTAILNTGAYPNGDYEFVNMDRTGAMQLQKLKTFSAKTFSVNSSNFDKSLLSRCISINTVRNKRLIKHVASMSIEDKELMQRLRNEIFGFVLFNWRDILDSIDISMAKLNEKNLFGRRSDIVSIVLGIMSFFNEDVSSLETYLLEKELLDGDDDLNFDRRYFIVKYILTSSVFVDDDVVRFTNKNLVQYIIEELDIDITDFEQKRFAPTSSSIGKLLKRSKIIISNTDVKREGGKGNVYYKIPFKRLVALVFRFEYLDLYQYIPDKYLTDSQIKLKMACVTEKRNVNDEDFGSQSEMAL